MIKYLGAILILFTSAYWGIKSSLAPYKRYKNLIKINSCFNAMKNEIRFSSDFIDKILLKVSNITDFNKIFLTASELSLEIPIAERWKRAIEYDSTDLYLSNDDKEVLNMFSAELGMTDREGQIKNIEHTISLLEVNIACAKEEYDKMSKLKKGLGISMGLFVIILLL